MSLLLLLNEGEGGPPPDVDAPDTSITVGPGSNAAPTADFTLVADETGCTFEVRLDGGSWVAASGTPASGSGVTTCAHRAEGLTPGPHTLQARATDSSANTDVTPAEWEWTTQRPAIHVRELPPLWLAHEIELPNGRRVRWGADEPDAAMQPSNVEFSNSMPGGHEQASARLPRKAGIDYGDQRGYSTWRIYGPGGEIAWEGRLKRSGRDADQGVSASPQGVGWQAHLEDDKTASFIGIDRDLGRWRGSGATRRLALIASYMPTGDGQAISDVSSGMPVLRLEVSGHITGASGGRSDAWYDAGAGNGIAGIICGSDQVANVAGSGWTLQAYGADDDAAGGLTAAVFTATGADPLATQYRALAAVKRWMYFRLLYNVPHTADENERWRDIKQIAPVGDHGLTLYGVAGEEGLLASDVVPYALARWAPLLRFTTGPNGTVTPSSFVIPHLAFPSPTTVAEMIRQAIAFELPDLAVWDNREFYMHPPGHRGRRWMLRTGPTKLTEAGTDMDRVWNGFLVAYRDVDGSTRTVGPPGSGADVESADLLDLDPLNPANAAGIPRRWDLLDMGKVSTPAGAITVGRRALELSKHLDRSGSAEIVGHAIDDRGIVHPYWAVRSGDLACWVDAADTSWRKIVRASNSAASRSCRIDLDAPPEALDAMLQRLDVDLVRLGIS